jgi:hypothetical protein
MALRTKNFFKPRNAVQYNFTQCCDSNVIDGDGGAVAFSIVTVTPPTGSQIDVDNTITIRFSKAANPGTVSYPRENGVAKAGGLSWNADFTAVTFTPSVDWAEGANVDWDLSAFTAADGSGTATNAFVAQWTVETIFALISLSPDPADPTDPLTARKPIIATFNGPVTDPSQLPIITEGGVQKPGSWTLGPGANEATFTPATDWDGNTTVVLDPSTGTDPNGDPIAGPIGTWTVPPLPFDFVSASPAANSSIAGTQKVTLTFSDDVAPSSSIVVLENGVPKAGTWVMNDVTAVFTPSTPWASGATVTFDTSAAVSVDGVSNTTPTVVPYTVPVTFTQTAVSPVTGSSIFGTDAITVSFNEAPDASTMPLPTENGVTKPGTWVAGPGANDLTFTPTSPYTSGATVIVDWTSVTDSLGNTPTNPGVASYNVKLDFSFSSSAPGAGGYVVLRDTIALTFNRPIDPTTLPMPLENGVAKPGSWSFSGNVATFTPSVDWSYGTSVTLDYTGGTSTDGVPLSNPGTLAFTVPNQLVQTLVTPATGSTLTNADTIAVTFNQPVDVSTMPLPTNSGGTPVPGTWVSSGSTITFTPAANWVLGDNFTVDWSAVMSLYNLPVTNPGTATYNTIPAFSATAVSPTPGSYIYGTNGISVTFNRAVDVSTLPNPTSNGVTVAGSWSISGSTATFTPTTSWTAGETVVMDYTTAADTLGNAVVNPNTATYLVAAELFQTAITVEHGTTLAAYDEITVTFDQPVDITTLAAPTVGGTAVPGNWTASGNSATFRPLGSWTAGQTVTVDWSSAASPLGVPVGNPGSTTFNTVPSMTLSNIIVPTATPVPTDQPSFTFSFLNGIPTSYPTVTYADGSAVAGTWSTLGASNHRFTPSATLNAADTITFGYDQVTDANGHPPHNITGPVVYTTEAFQYASFATAESDGNVRDLETVTFTFNAPVDPATLPAGFTTSDALPAFGMGTWTTSGNTATFTPSNNWQDVGDGPYNFDFNSLADTSGNAIGNPQIVPVAEEYLAFSYTSFRTTEGDGDVRDQESLTLIFTTPVDLATLPNPEDTSGNPVSGNWVSGPGANEATFTPLMNWEIADATGPFTQRLPATLADVNGTLIGNPQNLTIPLEILPFTYTSFVTAEGDGDVRGFETVSFTFSEPPDPATLPQPLEMQGATVSADTVPGTWSVSGNVATFTPNVDAWEADNPASDAFRFDFTSTVAASGTALTGTSVQDVPLEPVSFAAVSYQPGGTYTNVFGAVSFQYVGPNDVDLTSLSAPEDSGGTPYAGTWQLYENTDPASPGFGEKYAYFQPTSPWVIGDTVVLDTNGVLDTAGTAMANAQVLTYVFANAFNVLNWNSSTNNDRRAKGTEDLYVFFDQNIDITTMPQPEYSDGTPIPGTWSIGSTTAMAVFTPTNIYDADNYSQLVIPMSSSVLSLAGDPVTNPFDLTYTIDPLIFQFLAWENEDRAIQQGHTFYLYNTDRIRAKFEKAPDVSTLPTTLNLTGNATGGGTATNAVTGSWTQDGNDAIFTMDPGQTWGEGYRYVSNQYYMPTAGVTSVDGDPLVGGFNPLYGLGDMIITNVLPYGYVDGYSDGSRDIFLDAGTTNPLVVSTTGNNLQRAFWPLPKVNGVDVPGTWTSGSGMQNKFTPTNPWPASGTVTLDMTQAGLFAYDANSTTIYEGLNAKTYTLELKPYEDGRINFITGTNVEGADLVWRNHDTGFTTTYTPNGNLDFSQYAVFGTDKSLTTFPVVRDLLTDAVIPGTWQNAGFQTSTYYYSFLLSTPLTAGQGYYLDMSGGVSGANGVLYNAGSETKLVVYKPSSPYYFQQMPLRFVGNDHTASLNSFEYADRFELDFQLPSGRTVDPTTITATLNGTPMTITAFNDRAIVAKPRAFEAGDVIVIDGTNALDSLGSVIDMPTVLTFTVR